MYTIPKNFNLDNLKEATISQVAFSLNTISLFFDISFENIGFITIEGFFSFSYGNKKSYYEEIYPIKKDFGLLKLLGKKVIQIQINKKRDVVILEFEDKIILELMSNEMYESYTIDINGSQIIV